MARDNFLKSVIDKLRMRVSNRCSNPRCRVPTTAPAGNEDRVNNIGIAAHICAAAPGGPRYSKTMNAKQRSSINNAIWLCSNCSIEIDRDVDKYTQSLLESWKKQAESTAAEELGKKLPSKDDAINTVSAALTGFTKNFISTAIANVHNASEQSLQSLDPRFFVKSSYTDAGTVFGIFAKEDVTISMEIPGYNAKEYTNKYKQLIEHGEDLIMELRSIKFNGSKLIEEITNNLEDGKIAISSLKKKAVQKLWLKHDKGESIEYFDDIVGELSSGNKSFGFTGTACDGIFTFMYRATFGENKTNITFGLDYARWDGLDIRHLPYFSKLHSLFDKLACGWKLYTALELEGMRLLDSNGIDAKEIPFVNETRSVFYYISKVSAIANYLGISIRYRPDFSFTHEDLSLLTEIVRTINGQCVYSEKELTSGIFFDIEVSEGADNIEILRNTTKPTCSKLTNLTTESIKCFGESINLPNKTAVLLNVLLKLPSIDRHYKQGDTVRVELIPSKGFECRYEYEQLRPSTSSDKAS